MDLTLLQHMVSISSVFPHEGELAGFLYNHLQHLGFDVTKQHVGDGRYNVLAEKGHGDHALMFYGHLDTVPVYGEWSSDPYVLTQHGDRLIGLGTSDMKGGMFALLKAARDLTLPPDRKIKIALCVDEENNSLGAYRLSQHAFLEDVRLILSAEIGSPEGSVGKNVQTVALGRRGRVGINISVPGISAHGAMPQNGVNAIREACVFIKALAQMPMPYHEKLGKGSQFIQEIAAKSGSLSIPDRCDLYLSRLLVPPETPESALHEVQRYINDLYANGTVIPRNGRRVEVTLAPRDTPYYPPYITEEKHPQVQRLLQRLKQHFQEFVISYGLSVADENIFGGINQIPTVTLGPKGGNEHAADEWVSQRSLERLIPVYRDLLLHLAVG